MAVIVTAPKIGGGHGRNRVMANRRVLLFSGCKRFSASPAERSLGNPLRALWLILVGTDAIFDLQMAVF